MTSHKIHISIFFAVITISTACQSKSQVKEEDKIFHAGPVNSGFGVIYFGLYKDNKYQFCDGDFMDAGCYSGNYSLSGDTIILYKLRKHSAIPSNRFLIRRYGDMDSTYWQWKYPNSKYDWQGRRQSDLMRGADGDVLHLNQKGEIVLEKDNYFLIRLDNLKDYR